MKLFFTLITVLCSYLASVVQTHAAEPSKPNVLFIYTDDQRWDALGVVQREQGGEARFPWLQTPNLDRLAAEGIRFRNAFVTCSLCAPSRAVFLTGRYNHLNGVASNFIPFPANNVTHASLMGAAGYQTAYIGKWHMDGQKDRPGFGYSASFVGQGKYFDCPLLVNGKNTPTQGFVDDVTTDYTIDYLKANKDKPFSIVLGLKACHGGWTPPDRAKSLYVGEQPRPAVSAQSSAPYLGQAFHPRSTPQDEAASAKPHVYTNEQVLDYFRLIHAADDNVGRLLTALDELSLTENTIVILTSDNGYYLGEHGLGDKRSAYDESMRIPFIVRWPGLKANLCGTIRDEMVLNVDLAPTLLDFAGLPIPDEMQGLSWKPLLEGKTVPWRTQFLYEYFVEQNMSTPHIVALRTEQAKYITYPGHESWNEMFDLKSDPQEMHNLLEKVPLNVEMQRELATQLVQEQRVTKYVVPDYVWKHEPRAQDAEPKPKKRK